jgi:hypothetical protein
MAAHSDLVVSGTVDGVVGRGLFQPEGASSQEDIPKTPFTEYSFTVTRVFKGMPLGQVVIRQTGGTEPNGTIVSIEDDPLLAAGEQAVLFLKAFAPGHYFIIGGPAGRLDIDRNGNVHPLPGGSVTDVPIGQTDKLFSALTASVESGQH